MSSTARGRGLGWLRTGTGAALLAEEVVQVTEALDSVFGDDFLQLGRWGDPALFRGLARTRRQAVVDERPGPGIDLVSRLDELAVGGDCIDAVLLPHCLETVTNPHAVLREVDRILRPGGHVVILGFNPLGTWGLRHYASRQAFPRGLQRMIADFRIRDWLRLLNFSIQRESFYLFRAPLYRRGQPLDADRTSGLGARGLGSRLKRWQGFAASYIMVARKEAFAMTSIRLPLRPRPRLVAGLVNPTTRNAA